MKADKASTKVPSKYTDFADVFSLKLVVELPKHEINNHAIKLVNDCQLSYGPIYCLGLMNLEMFKTYIKNNLANCFIRSSKSPFGAPIFFDKKPDMTLKLCVDYYGLNNLITKNRYPLFLVRESLDLLS